MMGPLRHWLLRRIHEREERDAAEREEIRQQRAESAQVDRHARQVAERGNRAAERGLQVAKPTGMLVRDLVRGSYDPDSPLYGGRGRG